MDDYDLAERGEREDTGKGSDEGAGEVFKITFSRTENTFDRDRDNVGEGSSEDADSRKDDDVDSGTKEVPRSNDSEMSISSTNHSNDRRIPHRPCTSTFYCISNKDTCVGDDGKRRRRSSDDDAAADLPKGRTAGGAGTGATTVVPMFVSAHDDEFDLNERELLLSSSSSPPSFPAVGPATISKAVGRGSETAVKMRTAKPSRPVDFHRGPQSVKMNDTGKIDAEGPDNDRNSGGDASGSGGGGGGGGGGSGGDASGSSGGGGGCSGSGGGSGDGCSESDRLSSLALTNSKLKGKINNSASISPMLSAIPATVTVSSVLVAGVDVPAAPQCDRAEGAGAEAAGLGAREQMQTERSSRISRRSFLLVDGKTIKI
jgi:hypothetical protein